MIDRIGTTAALNTSGGNTMRITLFLILALTSASHARPQWEPDTRLTNEASYSSTSTNRASIQADGDYVHVVWTDGRDGALRAYYKRSTDGGKSWGEDAPLTNPSDSSTGPGIAAAGAALHVVWTDRHEGKSNIHYKRSLDGGLIWSRDFGLTPDSVQASTAHIAVAGGDVHVLWREFTAGIHAICYTHSSDGGITWGSTAVLTSDSSTSNYPQLAVSDSNVYAIWENWRDVKSPEIFCRHSSDGGRNWGMEMRLTVGYFSRRAAVEAHGSDLHLAWDDCSSGNFEIFYKRSSDKGLTWGAETRLSMAPGNSLWPAMAVSGSGIHVAWVDNRGGYDEIYYAHSLDGGANWSREILLADNFCTMSEFPSIAVSGSAVHLVWKDKRDGPNGEIYYKRNPTGNTVTEMEHVHSAVPPECVLLPNYPNPVSGSTIIAFQLPSPCRVRLSLYDAYGREAGVVLNQDMSRGSYRLEYDPGNLEAGAYFLRLNAGTHSDIRKLMIMK